MLAALVMSGVAVGDVEAQASGGGAAEAASAPVPVVVTTGSGEARLTPDRAVIVLGVQTRAATAAEASAENARRQRAVLDTLRALGFASEQLSTLNYNVFPETRFDPQTQRQVRTGYVVMNNVRVEVRRVDQVARAIDAALAKGSNQVASLSFSSSNTDEARRAALASAVARARGDAEAMAHAAGGSLGPLLELSTVTGGVRPMQMEFQAVRAGVAGGMDAPTPVEPGQQTVQVTVTARWQFVR